MLNQTIRTSAILVLFAGTAFAGPLNPPNGPITSTYKTLTEVEPRTAINADNTPGDGNSVFRITSPGSYYLPASFTVTSGKAGIELAASNVTIDLSGFRIGGADGSLDGINAAGLFGITIRNGVIYNLDGDGIDATGCSASRVDGVTVLNSAGQGIIVGIATEIINCTVATNGSHGINTQDSCTITNCIARGNTGVGIDVDDSAVITGCTASENGGIGISANVGATISNCSAVANIAEGFNAHDWCVLRDCISRNNGGAGFAVYQQPNATRCTAVGNTGAGFDLVFGGTIEGCNASFNGLNGIRIKGDGGFNAAVLLNNVCSSNTNSTGIYVEAAGGVRVEGNHCNFNGSRGIHITSANNLILKNSCRGNTGGNYQFVANNDYGIILVNPGEGFASSAAWANFDY